MDSRIIAFTYLFFWTGILFCEAQTPYAVIPVPAEIVPADGLYVLEGQPDIKELRLPAGKLPAEGYILEITPDEIVIESSDQAGAFYARQTLKQMMRGGKAGELQCCRITDSPRFPYRGMHFDVSRHFRSIGFLKKQIDAMACFKMNRMHLHLTDAAGWRLQIDAYPRLTEFAAWRPYPTWKEWWNGDRSYVEKGTDCAYGGYYTKEEIRDLVEYARDRHIEIIPEIEMPGHSEEVLAAYPELSCKGIPYAQGEFCAGNDEVFRFLETVLMEVMDLFPSEFIHIGGDEASMQHWKTCSLCQKRMVEEGMTDVVELQSYMIRRIARFVEEHGRRIIGWDEILEGGLAPGAAVMSWRGTEGGIKAMNQGHDVIMTPGRYCYLDHAQDAPFKEPESIGGYLPLDTVYVYEPADPSMFSDKLHHLKGLQANLWSEYVVTDEHAEYMYWPRTMAIAETAWSIPENKNLKDFRRRVQEVLQDMKEAGYNVFDLSDEYGERRLALSPVDHKARGCEVSYVRPFHESYPAAGALTLTDGMMGGWTYSDGRWQGFLSDVDVIIDLGSVQHLEHIGGTFMQLIGPGVFMPQKVEVHISDDGVEFTRVAEISNDVSYDIPDLTFRSFDASCDVYARYVRYKAERSTRRGFLFLDEITVN